MSNPNSYLAGGQNQMHPRNNPEHPAWKLPPNQAYVATREERTSIYKRAGKTGATTSTPSAALPTSSGNHAVDSPTKPVLPVPEPKSKQEIKADAAAAVTAAYKRHGSGFRIRVQPPEQWESEAKALSARDGCDFMEAMYRTGFVHAAVSFPPVGGRG